MSDILKIVHAGFSAEYTPFIDVVLVYLSSDSSIEERVESSNKYFSMLDFMHIL